MATERITTSEVESVIRQLKDVLGARVVTDASGVIQEIHVLSQGDRAPKQVVRDIESALQARLGITLDHKKVSVAQVQGAKPAESVPERRLQFADVSMALTGQTAEATVRLKKDDQVYTGSARGASTASGQIKAVAAAALNAVQSYLPTPTMMTIEDAVVSQVGGFQVITVVVTISGDRTDEVLCGSCVVRQDPVKAAVFATMDAINRRVTLER